MKTEISREHWTLAQVLQSAIVCSAAQYESNGVEQEGISANLVNKLASTIICSDWQLEDALDLLTSIQKVREKTRA